MSWISLRRTRGTRTPVPFDCPRCDGSQGFRTSARWWLALLGRAILPMGRTERYLECGSCGRTFAARAVAAGGASEDEKAVQALVAAVVMADMRVRSREMEVARRVLERYGGRALRAEDLVDELHRLRRRVPKPLRYLTRIAPLLGDRGKMRIIEAVYDVCVADNELHPAETELIRSAGEALDLSPMRVREAMQRARENR
ncbi:MAG: TerB family tellurite resistance protein [Gemmatimonadota bacterium]|jgi:uncharacterized tellurite resistance protein B-like protein